MRLTGRWSARSSAGSSSVRRVRVAILDDTDDAWGRRTACATAKEPARAANSAGTDKDVDFGRLTTMAPIDCFECRPKSGVVGFRRPNGNGSPAAAHDSCAAVGCSRC